MLNIVFMGTPDIAKESLEALVDAEYPILGVVTNPDRPQGRGMKMISTPVKEYAISKNIKVYQPEKVKKNEEFLKEIQELNPDLICVISYGKILPKKLLDIPNKGCVNVHYSLLPKYRGAAPVQWAVLNGDKTTGVTTIYIDTGLDTGDIIYQKETPIGQDETTGELFTRLSKMGAELLVKTVRDIEKGVAPRKKQEGESNYAPMLEREMSKIDWENQSADEIKNLVRGLNPIMGAYTCLNDKKLKFWKVDILSQERLCELFPELKEYEYKLKDIDPGTVLFSGDKEGLYIKTKDGFITVLEIQAENKGKMNIHDFLRGNQINSRKYL